MMKVMHGETAPKVAQIVMRAPCLAEGSFVCTCRGVSPTKAGDRVLTKLATQYTEQAAYVAELNLSGVSLNEGRKGSILDDHDGTAVEG